MADQGTYNAINGKEARDLLFTNLRTKIDKLPMLSLGNTFHRLTMVGGIELSAFPTDVPVPEVEFEILLETPEVSAGEFNNHFKKVEDLLQYREKLIAKLQEIDSIVEKVAPIAAIPVAIGGDVPDAIRVEGGLPVPVLRSVGDGRKAEVNVDTKEIVKLGATKK